MAPEESVEVRVADESGKINLVQGSRDAQGAPRLGRSLSRLFEYLRRYEPGRTDELRDTEARVFLRLGLLPPRDGEARDKPEPLVTLRPRYGVLMRLRPRTSTAAAAESS